MFASSGVTWDGFYIGAHWGYGVGATKWRNPTGLYAINPPANGYNDGQLAGAQIGYNKQVGSVVAGVEADVSAGSLIGYANCGAGIFGSGDTCANRTNLIASLTGRLGYATGRALLYAKGGVAYTRDKIDVSNDMINLIESGPARNNRFGWTLGGGVAYALDANWSAFAEYNYYSFGKHTYKFAIPGNAYNVSHTQHVAKFGVNYRFGGAGGGVAGPPLSNDVTGEFGTRAGFSSGRFKKKLWDNVTPGQLNSILTWPYQAGLATEAFARLDHKSGVFVKGALGGVSLGKGHMNDEDTAAAMAPFPYSNTRSSTKNGRDLYGSADIGYAFLRTSTMRLEAFAGWGYYQQRLNAYGCEQVGGSVVCIPAGSTSPGALALSETERWNALRLGVGGSVMLTERLKLSGEAVWLANALMMARDNHWFRPDINPLIEKGRGSKNYQVEANLSYAITDRWSIGAGARYMSLKSAGGVVFPGWGLKSPEKFESSRLTGFLQASYRFGDVAPVVAKY